MPQYNFIPFPEIQTQSLLLRQLLPSDREAIFVLRSDEAVNQYIARPRPTDISEADAFIDKIAQRITEGQSVYWAITQAPNPALIGTICLWNFSEDGSMAEIGYELMPAYQGKGIMQAAIQAVLEYAFAQLGFDMVEAYTSLHNKPSIQLLLRNGFVHNPNKTDEDFPLNHIYFITKTVFYHAALP